MQQRFLQNIQKIDGFSKKKFLLAISGGLDSVVLSHLCKQAGLNFEMAHCNFKLRGKESDGDQKFVEQWHKTLNVPLHIKICDLVASDEKNIQIAARDARYNWFNELKNKYHFDYLLTAHHLDDSIETFFINLQRGAGINGLTGIKDNDTIIRPLINCTRNEIDKYAQNHKLSWREDSSNASTKYKRNFIRHEIIPKFEAITPSFKQAMQKTISHLQQSNAVVNEWFLQQKKQIVYTENDTIFLNISKLKELAQKELFLHYFLLEYGFSDHKAALNLLDAKNGKFIDSNNYKLIKHHEYLIISDQKNDTKNIYEVANLQDITEPISLSFSLIDATKIEISKIKSASKNEIYADYEKVSFPLTLRKWQEGDYFYPLGMQGKMKISDYYINQKFSLVEKEKNWLLCDRKNIIWVVGHRTDDRYKITKQTKQILHIKLHQL